MAQRRGIRVELSSLIAAHEGQLRAAGALAAASPTRHRSIDAAVTAWDEHRLADLASQQPGGCDIKELLSQQLGRSATERLQTAFEAIPLAPGGVLFERGSLPDALYVVAQGRLAVVAPNGHGDGELTVRTLMPGSTVGEMGVFRQQARTNTVRAEVDTVVLKLSIERLAELEAKDPEVAAALYRLFMRQMANRVDQLTAQAHMLSR